MASTRSLLTLVTAVGLALLLVVGAWTASHGDADVHASLCLAPEVSAGESGAPGDASAAAGAGHHGPAATAAVSTAPGTDGLAIGGFALLWLVALLVLLTRFARPQRGVLLPRSVPAARASRADPGIRPAAPSLSELCLSRT